MLTPLQRDAFETDGFVRIPAAFPAAAAMQARVWELLGRRYGVDREDPTTWKGVQPTHLQSFRTHSVFEPIGSDATLGAIDDLLGAERRTRPKHWGQFLISFPDGDGPWSVPAHVWHTDFPFVLPPAELQGLLVFSFLSDVPAHAGSTAVVVGGQRVVRNWVESRPREAPLSMKRARREFIQSDPWLRRLSSKTDDSDRIARFVETGGEVCGVPVRVAELTGEAGDVIVAHPWLLHSPARNCGEQPRMMRVQRIRAG